MIVCVCNGVNDRQVKAAIRDGATSLEALSGELGVACGCGCCRETCNELLEAAGCTGCSSMPAHLRAIPLMQIAA